MKVDVVVVGLGAMGSAALWQLARRGVSAAGVEVNGTAHALGSSHGKSRVIRKAYFEHPSYVPLLERSYALWRELERESGEELLRITGCVNLGRPNNPLVRAVLESVSVHGLAAEILDARSLMARFPAFFVADDVVGVYEADGGVLGPEACVAAQVGCAVKQGAQVIEKRVVGVTSTGAGVRVELDDGDAIEAREIVIACGPWTPSTPWVPLKAPLVVTRQVQCWFDPPSEAFSLKRMPAFIEFLDDGRNYYGLPPYGGGGVKVCRHGGGVVCTPDTIDRTVHDADVDDVRGYLRKTLPALDAKPAATSACMYTNTPDAHFLIGRVAFGAAHAVVLAGFSGHGFKMASVVGEIAADLAVDGKTRHDIALFAPDRFATKPPARAKGDRAPRKRRTDRTP